MSRETSRGMAMLAALFMTGMRLERLITSCAGYRTGS
jgi:hypothetical protein